MKKRVFFQLVDTLSMGGTERMSINMAAAFAEQGWESHLVVSRRGGGLESKIPDSVHVHFLEKRSFADLFAFLRLVRLHSRFRPSVFHAHSTSIYWAAILKILTGRFLLVWHDHFGLSDKLEVYPRKEMVIFAKWIDRIVTVNDRLQYYWQSLLPYKSSLIRTIGNFPMLTLPKLDPYRKFTFLNLANFRPQKDQLNLVHAVANLHSKFLDFEVLMVGEVVDSNWLKEIEAEIHRLGLQDRITIAGPSKQVEKLLAQAQAGILSSESEGLPVALLEYGLAGLPIVCTAVGDCSQVIDDPALGFLVPAKDPVRMAQAMEKLMLASPEERSAMGAMLRTRVDQNFGVSAFLRAYFDLLSIS